MANGSIPSVYGGRCPPPIINPGDPNAAPTWPNPTAPFQVCLGDLVNSLFDIEQWLKTVRMVLEKLPPETCVTIDPNAPGSGILED